MNPIKKFAYYSAQIGGVLAMIIVGILDAILILGSLGRLEPRNICACHAWFGKKLDWFLD